MTVLLQILGVLVGTAASAVTFNVPRAALPWAALTGLMGWAVQTQAASMKFQVEAGALLGALTVSLAAEGLARARRMPALVFVVPGILPLVPGTRAYQAMLAVLREDHAQAAVEGVQALLAAGGIAIGILMATALTRGWGRSTSKAESPRQPRRRPGPRSEPPPRRAVVLPLWGRGPGRPK